MGGNSRGQLGTGNNTNVTTPVQVLTDVKDVDAGAEHTLVLTTSGRLLATGYNNRGQIADEDSVERNTFHTVDKNVVDINCGRSHSLYRKEDGTLWGMGLNVNGILGNSTGADVVIPIKIAEGVKAVFNGNYHSFFFLLYLINQIDNNF